MKIRLLIALFFTTLFIFAQNKKQRFVNDSKSTVENNYMFGTSVAIPCYSSEKLKNLIETTNFSSPFKLSEEEFNSLSAFEHFVHSFYYQEHYFQSCSMFFPPKDVLQKIPAFLKREGEGLRMSNRQSLAISQQRDYTIILMRNCIIEKVKVDDDFKSTIINLKLYELVPDLIATLEYQTEIKDPYILTTLCLLMRFDYTPFIDSKIYNSLYSTESLGGKKGRIGYDISIPFTEANYSLIVKFAKEYFNHKSNSESEFVHVKKGVYKIGEKDHQTNPLREIEIQPFLISRYEITNKQFLHFVANTDYLTLAEKNKDAFVFRLGLDEFEWIQDPTANWKYPNGFSEGGIEDKMNHPVTCISYVDAKAYCRWAKVRLPSIEEWEVASRGTNFTDSHYFGDSLELIYLHANVWHGRTHLMKYEGEDYLTTSPVGAFKANPIGLYDVYGNVFEFCSNVPMAFDGLKDVVATRGGSWWCSFYACGFFNSVDIGRVQKEATFSNNGFRVVL